MKRKNAPGMGGQSYPRIWEAVRSIPRGRVATYGQIAAFVNRPGHARLVGYALHNLPDGVEIPWHRVVNARGAISLPGDGGRSQRELLTHEGIVFEKNRVDLRHYGWQAGRKGSSRRR